MLTMVAYSWFVLPPSWTKTPLPIFLCSLWAVASLLSVLEVQQDFSFADRFYAVLVIVIVPEIVPSKYIPTAAGAHKSVLYFDTAC
jgi:hypothetical protein